MPSADRTLHFPDIQPTLDGLLFNVERDLRRRSEAATDPASAKAFLVLRIAALNAQNYCHAVRFLCADEEIPGRRPMYALVVPSLNRTMMEILFTIIYLLEDFPARVDLYQKAGWRELSEELHKYKTDYASRPEWKPFVTNFQSTLRQGTGELGITEAEANDPRSIEYWKSGYQLIDRTGPINRPFVRWLDKWFYHEVSAIAHFDPYGLQKTAMFLISDQASEEQQKSIASEALPGFRAFHVFITIMIVVALVSEFEAAFKLGNREQIVKIWSKLRHVIPDAEEMCSRRYDQLLSMLA